MAILSMAYLYAIAMWYIYVAWWYCAVLHFYCSFVVFTMPLNLMYAIYPFILLFPSQHLMISTQAAIH